jgi:hypothetical protein
MSDLEPKAGPVGVVGAIVVIGAGIYLVYRGFKWLYDTAQRPAPAPPAAKPKPTPKPNKKPEN